MKQEDHSAQFYATDPLIQAVTRTMGAQNVKPLSLELRDELARELAVLRAQLEAEVKLAMSAEAAAQRGTGGAADEAGPASVQRRAEAASSGNGSGSGGWFGRWFGGAQGEAAAGTTSSRRPTLAAIRAGQHPGLSHAAEAVRLLIKQYNTAVLQDKETFGAFWPLNPARQLDWAAEVEAAVAAATVAVAAQSRGSRGPASSTGSKAGGT